LSQTTAFVNHESLEPLIPVGFWLKAFSSSVMSANIGLDDPDLTAIVTDLNELAFAALFVRHAPVMSVIG
jgi:hypothetical protein